MVLHHGGTEDTEDPCGAAVTRGDDCACALPSAICHRAGPSFSVVGWPCFAFPAVENCAFVKLSVKSDYAARAVLGLARHYPTNLAVRVEQLAREQGVPANYLVQILIELKAQRIVKSHRGKEGGYLLARPPAEITLADILRSVHGQLFDSPALSDQQCPVELKDAWRRLQRAVEEEAASINFQQLLEADGERDRMFYI